jgi:hypothetical protein
MRSRLSFISLFSLLLLASWFTSCQKDESVVSDDSQQLSFRDPQSFAYSQDSVGVGDTVVITFDIGNGADCGHVQIQVSGPDGNGWSGGQPVTPDSGLAVLNFVPNAPGEYSVRAKYTRTGKPSDCDFESTKWLVSPDLIVVGADSIPQDTTAQDSCEESFTGEVITCDSSTREVVYTLVSDEDLNYFKIKGGLTSGVEGDPTVTVTGADLDVEIKTPGHSSNRVITLTGSAVACDTITITIAWTSNNSGDVITGDWSASGGGLNLEVGELECE